MKISIIFLALFATLAKSASISRESDFIRCTYDDALEYTCMLDISNPNGLEFENIDGDHLSGFGNADVLTLSAYAQNTRNVPSVICRQFPNLERLIIIYSEIQEVTAEAFSACSRLVYLNLNHNAIARLPDNWLRNSENLDFLNVYDNQISVISESAFEGTRVSFLDLSDNQIEGFNLAVFEPIRATLRNLFLSNNQITSLQPNAFHTLSNLESLNLDGNNLGLNIPWNAFNGLDNLDFIALDECGLTTLHPWIFQTLPRVSSISLSINRFARLPRNIFDLPNLSFINLGLNEFRDVSTSAFGRSLRTLTMVTLSYNQISSIDPNFISGLANTHTLMLSGNQCTQDIFSNIPNNTDFVNSQLSNCFNNFRLNEVISCDFMPGHPMEPDEYTCALTVNNPSGREFDRIEGSHLEGRSDEDVNAVVAFYQNTPIIPEVICRQFPNAIRIQLVASGVQELTAEAFAHCFNLQELSLVQNEISEIRENIFVNASSLRLFEVEFNGLVTLHPLSFAGSAIENLDLAFNEIAEYNPDWFAPIAGSLRWFNFMANQITSVPDNAFSNLINLEDIFLNYNQLTIPSNAFLNATNLVRLSLGSCGLRSIDPAWFSSLANLRFLYLQNNNIRELPPNSFSSLVNLRDLYVYQNRIREIDLDSFGASLNSLFTFYANDNDINLVDPRWLNAAESLEYLLLSNNFCINEDFLNFQFTRWRIFESMHVCIDNYESEPAISCTYQNLEDGGYACIISTNNVRGASFDRIEGQHLEGRQDSDVTVVSGLFQNTRNIPSILCDTFENLSGIMFLNSNVEDIEESSFANCGNLHDLILQQNRISEIFDFTFRGAPNLAVLNVGGNRINHIGNDAFAGTSIAILDLFNNRISEFNPAWFSPIGSTLTNLELGLNRITSLPNNAFENVPGLVVLVLSDNLLGTIGNNVFRPLTNLGALSMSRCGLNNLNPAWFETLTSLVALYVTGNNIGNFDDGIFNPLTSLTHLVFYDNNLRSLSAEAFGDSLNSITQIYASNNRIRAFDQRIIERASNLEWLLLSGNICSGQNFPNVQENVEEVLRQLFYCVNNFGAERLECEFNDFDRYYCSLTMFNPLGRDDFTTIGGTHVQGRGDEDVTVVYASYQNSLNIPQIVCQRFVNTVEMIILASQMEYIDEGTFADCIAIEDLTLYYNEIESIPANSFRNNPNLHRLSMSMNRITTLNPMSFAGSGLVFIDLSANPLGRFDPRWFEVVNTTLTQLDLIHSDITSFDSNSFVNLRGLRELLISANPVGDFPADVFHPLVDLEELHISQCEIRRLNPAWFTNLSSLRFLTVAMNHIPNLPRNAFDNLNNLETLYLYNNQIRELTVESFGSSISAIRMLYVIFNQISAIDPTFIDAATNLDQLYLSGNLCSNMNFIDIQDRLEFVRNNLQQCTSNYIANHIRCSYFETGEGQYACMLEINNPLGRDAFDVVDGDHLPGRSDADVEIININAQDTRNIPAILCEQFPNAVSFIAIGSGVEFLYDTSFAGCRNLTSVVLWNNIISEVPANTFVHNPLLSFLELGSNRIEQLDPDSFSGTSIEFLDISNNRLRSFDPNWFNSINDTLRTLDLLVNEIEVLPVDAFRTIRDLEVLVLSFNPLRTIPPNSFIALDLLEVLALTGCGLERLEPMWFMGLRSLRQLLINNNEIGEFEFGIFSNLLNLQTLNFRGNFIWELNSNHFGSSLQTITMIDGADNLINILDPVIISDATELNFLTLHNNLCINQDFTNVNQYLWLVLEYLSECSNNLVLDATASCAYSQSGTEYLCSLTSHNPRGESFTEIDGDHLANRNNSDVSVVFATRQNMRNIPSVICTQFENLIEIFIVGSNIMELTPATFADCRNLEYIFIDENFIRVIPNNLLINNANLHFVSLAGNLISNIQINAFVGSAISFLDIAFNRLRTFEAGAFERINGTLRTIDAIGNQISELNDQSFRNIRGLDQLILNYNPLGLILPDTFSSLEDLQLLGLSSCGLTALPSTAFRNLVNLRSLFLHVNSLTDLPQGLLNDLTSLESLYLYENRIRELRANSFGNSLNSLRILYGTSNQINGIDPALLDSSEQLLYLLLSNNLCTNEDFFDVQNNIEEVRTRLSTCINNFVTPPSISCTYEMSLNDEYVCMMDLHDPQSFVEFTSIGGTHMAGRTNEDVILVSAMFQNARFVPSIICRQFENLREMLMLNNNIEELNRNSFADCRHLEQVFLNLNRITIIMPLTFSNSPNLRFLGLSSNRLNFLHPTSLSGTALRSIDLAVNWLTEINPLWLIPISETLTHLDLIDNRITTLSSTTFSSLRNLEVLALNYNRLTAIDDNTFDALTNLWLLSLGHCGLSSLSPRWFENLTNLTELLLPSNEVSELPSGIFNHLPLNYFDIYDNRFEVLSSAPFGGSLQTLVTIIAGMNAIDAVDPLIIGPNLDNLYLRGNVCVDQNFDNVTGNVDQVREALTQCFNNFP